MNKLFKSIDIKAPELKTPKYTLGDVVEYLEGTYEVVEVLTEGVHLKNVHKPFNSEVVGFSELGIAFDNAVENFGSTQLAKALVGKEEE